MRTIILLLSLVFFPLSALATDSCITSNTPNPVLRVVRDTEGNPLNKHSRYFVVSAIWGAGGGGVDLANLGDQEDNTCPTSVVQYSQDQEEGRAVYFKPKNPKQEEIVESSSVNIDFYSEYYISLCFNITVWKVDNYPKPAEHYTVSTGAKLGNPLDVNSWFQIKALSASTYKLVFCPYGDLEFTCRNVGIANEKGYRRLVLSDDPKAFVFKQDKRIRMAIE